MSQQVRRNHPGPGEVGLPRGIPVSRVSAGGSPVYLTSRILPSRVTSVKKVPERRGLPDWTSPPTPFLAFMLGSQGSPPRILLLPPGTKGPAFRQRSDGGGRPRDGLSRFRVSSSLRTLTESEQDGL